VNAPVESWPGNFAEAINGRGGDARIPVPSQKKQVRESREFEFADPRGGRSENI
jgi:hypothetical protein